MSNIIELWKKDKTLFDNKKLYQIIQFAGDGKLKDNNSTSIELRTWLDFLSTEEIEKYVNECLETSFPDSGLILQDLINQIGKRLGFIVNYGLYRGKRNEPGFDGIWRTEDSFNILIEVKTTDTYRINLDRINEYRKKYFDSNEVYENSSILIVVGREDTGDLEAQIRGSRLAWDTRLISVDSLIKLMKVKEKLSDPLVSHRINNSLRPVEFTRIDSLIDLIFDTANEIEQEIDIINDNEDVIERKRATSPVNFQEACINKFKDINKTDLIKQSRTTYKSSDGKYLIVLAISKEHAPATGYDARYWFAFHPHQDDFLSQMPENAYVLLGCGSEKILFNFPYKKIKELLPYMWKTEKEDRGYRHIVIFQTEDKFVFRIPYNDELDYMDITDYLIK